jgi:hypothetical protein
MGLFRFRRAPRPAAPCIRPTLESLEGRVVPTITLPAAGKTGAAVLAGTTGNDQFLIRLQPGSPANIQFSEDGGTTFKTAALSSITEVDISGTAGGKLAVTVNDGNGLVGKSAGLPVVFTSLPATAAATLTLTGNPGAAEQEGYAPAAGGGASQLASSAGGASRTVSFTALQSVTDTTPGTLAVNLNNTAHLLEVLGGTAVGGLATMRVVGVDRTDTDLAPDYAPGGNVTDPTGRAVVPITFANKTTVTVAGGSAVNQYLLDAPQAASGLTTLRINGGASSNDSLIEKAAPAGVTFSGFGIRQTDSGQAAAFIQELYGLRLGRSASGAEATFWEGVLAGPGGQAAVVNGIDGSAEALDYEVKAWYSYYLGRQAVGGEEMAWVGMLGTGTSEEQALTGIIGSAEFAARHAATVATGNTTPSHVYIQAVYATALHRAASAAEVAFWANVFDASGAGAVAQGVLNSAEFRTDQVMQFYTTLLHRQPDAAGLSAWVYSGMSLGNVRAAFEQSAEFYAV